MRQRSPDRRDRILAAIELAGDEMSDDLGVGLAGEDVSVGLELGLELAEVLDDAVMDDRQLLGGVRMGVCFSRLAMRRPTGVTDADQAVERLAGEAYFEILELALGAAAAEPATFERRDAGGIIAAIFEPLQRSLPSARRRARTPFSSVATPAES